MRSALYVVAHPMSGRLATMARPPGGDRLLDGLRGLAESGVDLLVSALTDDEMTELSLVGEEAAAVAAGLRFLRYPIPDVSIPPSLPHELALAGHLADEVRAGRFVAIHCRAGIGRSSMLAGAVLVRLGVPAGQAWALIREARGLAVPDSDEQERWLFHLADSLAG